jgi:signal transduction histidine kinase
MPAAPPRVLVVYAGPSPLEEIARDLGQGGYEVLTVSTPDEALALLSTDSFSLVLTDVDTSGDTGAPLLGEIGRLSPQTAGLVLTSYERAELTDSIGEGGCDYLITPCPMPVLRAAVARAIERAALARALREGLEELEVANEKLRTLSAELQLRVDEATGELRQRVDEIDEANRQLEQAHRDREAFVGMIAHDLGGPLTSIVGYLQLLGERGLPARVRDRARTTMLSEARRMARLLDDLVEASRLASGRFRVEPTECDLSALVRERVQVAQLGGEPHSFHLDAPRRPVRVLGDPDRLAQVISNLLNNAVIHAPGGDVRVELRGGEAVRLTVSDEGPGIPAEQLEAVFEPHVRLTDRRGGGRVGGRGLGLYIARLIVEAHGGRIWATAGPFGVGTAIHVSLPSAATVLPTVDRPAHTA